MPSHDADVTGFTATMQENLPKPRAASLIRPPASVDPSGSASRCRLTAGALRTTPRTSSSHNCENAGHRSRRRTRLKGPRRAQVRPPVRSKSPDAPELSAVAVALAGEALAEATAGRSRPATPPRRHRARR